MAKKRTKLELIRDILEILKKGKGVKITHLIYKANLSNNSIKPYIENLLGNNLIEQVQEEDKKVFKITPKGMRFLEEFDKMKVFSESYGLNGYI